MKKYNISGRLSSTFQFIKIHDDLKQEIIKIRLWKTQEIQLSFEGKIKINN